MSIRAAFRRPLENDMIRLIRRTRRYFLAAIGSGTTFLLSGCDPTIQATVEDGIITASNSLLAAFLRAIVELGAEDPDQSLVQALITPFV